MYDLDFHRNLSGLAISVFRIVICCLTDEFVVLVWLVILIIIIYKPRWLQLNEKHKFCTVRIVLKSNRKIVQQKRGKLYTSKATHIYTWRVTLVAWYSHFNKTLMVKWCCHVNFSRTPTLTYRPNWAGGVVVKIAEF